jgi:serine protease Do
MVLVAILITPYLAEQIQYAITRGRQRAEAEVARGQLAALPEINSVFSVVAKAVEPSVVGVVTTRDVRLRRFDEWSQLLGKGPQFRSEGLGSGVIVDAGQGYIITNAHVIDKAARISVQLSDGRTIQDVRVVGSDPLTDIAVLKIAAGGLTAAPWGDSNKLEVGDPVLAVGNPFGLTRTVTAGIVSAKERRGMAVGTLYQDFLQTDAAINPGNSGGPLLNTHGEVVGINTAIVGEAYRGISFAIPSNMAKDVYERLKTSGKVVRGWLGVTLQSLDEELARRLKITDGHGAVVTSVIEGGPADQAGIQPGDVIVEFNGKPIREVGDLLLAVGSAKVGSDSRLTVLREGKRAEQKIRVGERPAQVE